MYVAMTTTTSMLFLMQTHAYTQTHTHNCSLTTHASVSRPVSSHGSHRFTLIILGSSSFSTLHHDNCLNSFPLSPTSVLSERGYHGNWLQLMGPKRHDWHTQLVRTHAAVPARTHTLTVHTHFAHSLLCKALCDIAYYFGCMNMHTYSR